MVNGDWVNIDDTSEEDHKLDDSLDGYCYEEPIKFKVGKEEFNRSVLFIGKKTDIAKIRKNVNVIKNELEKNRTDTARIIFEEGITSLLNKLSGKSKNPELINAARILNKLTKISEQEAIDEQVKRLHSKIGRYYTEEEFNQDCLSLGRNPLEYKTSIDLTSMARSKGIKQWLFDNVTDSNGLVVGDVRTRMINDGMIERGSDSDWQLVKTTASRLKMSRGSYGRWYPPMES